MGYMSTIECVPGGVVPTRKWFRVWGCGSMFETQASVVVVSVRSKSGTMIDRDKRRRMKEDDIIILMK